MNICIYLKEHVQIGIQIVHQQTALMLHNHHVAYIGQVYFTLSSIHLHLVPNSFDKFFKVSKLFLSCKTHELPRV